MRSTGEETGAAAQAAQPPPEGGTAGLTLMAGGAGEGSVVFSVLEGD